MNIGFNHNMQIVECWICGCLFALPENLYLHAQEKGKGFHCPNGHSLGFGPGRLSELEEELAEAKLTEARLRSSWKGAATENERLLKRLDKKKKK